MQHGNTSSSSVLARIAVALMLIQLSIATCPPYTVCTKRRDVIIQTDRIVTGATNPKKAGRSWFVKMDTVGNVLLHFKSFKHHGNSVAAFAYKDKKLSDARIFYRQQSGFQVLLEDCDLLVLYLPFFESPLPTFELEYFWGCGVIKNSQHMLRYDGAEKMEKERGHVSEQQHACWFIEPDDKIQTIYVSAQKVKLGQDQSLKVWDLASKNVLLKMNASEEFYGLTALDYKHSQPLIVELSCPSSQQHCSVLHSSFIIKHHAMKKPDMECVERHRCEGEEEKECDIDCPAVDKLLHNQYGISRRVSMTRMGETTTTTEGFGSGSVSRPVRCPLKPKYCICPAHIDREAFCNPRVYCKNQKVVRPTCMWACIYAKIKLCPALNKRQRKAKQPTHQQQKHVKLL